MYLLHFWFEHGGGCLWSKNRDASDAFGYKVRYQDLPLSDSLKEMLAALEARYATYLNWNDPAAPSPWTSEEKQTFLTDAEAAYHTLCEELGHRFLIENELSACVK